MLPIWLTSFMLWSTFHIFRYFWPSIEPKASFSIYFEDSITQDGFRQRKLNKSKVLMPFARAFTSLFSLGCVNLSFKFFQDSGSTLNPGIISILFTLNLVFSTLTFFVLSAWF